MFGFARLRRRQRTINSFRVRVELKVIRGCHKLWACGRNNNLGRRCSVLRAVFFGRQFDCHRSRAGASHRQVGRRRKGFLEDATEKSRVEFLGYQFQPFDLMGERKMCMASKSRVEFLGYQFQLFALMGERKMSTLRQMSLVVLIIGVVCGLAQGIRICRYRCLLELQQRPHGFQREWPQWHLRGVGRAVLRDRLR